MAVLTWDAASSCVSGPPSSAASRVDGVFALRRPVQVYGGAGSDDLWASAAPTGHLNSTGDE